MKGSVLTLVVAIGMIVSAASSAPAAPAHDGAPAASPAPLRDLNCDDFSSQAAAQNHYNGQGGVAGGDPDGLDTDHDGVACESNPCPCSNAGPGSGGSGGGSGSGSAEPTPPPPPPDPVKTSKLCGHFKGVSSSRVCLRAVTKGEKLKKVKSFRFKRLPSACGNGSSPILAGKDRKIDGDGKRFSSRHGKVLGSLRGVRILIAGKVSGGGKKARGFVSVGFKTSAGDVCHTGNRRWKVT